MGPAPESPADVWWVVARPKRFELLTPRFVVWCSIQLSYGRGAPCLKETTPPLARWQGSRRNGSFWGRHINAVASHRPAALSCRHGLSLLALVVLFLSLACTAQAQSVSSADRAAIRQGHPGPGRRFPPRRWRRRLRLRLAHHPGQCSARRTFSWTWCRQGYQPVYRPRAFDFREIVELHGQPAQTVDVIGPDGRPVTAIYPMRQLPDGHVAASTAASCRRRTNTKPDLRTAPIMERTSPKVLAAACSPA